MLSYAVINNLRSTSESPFSFFSKIASKSSRIEKCDRELLEKHLTYGIFLFDPYKYDDLYRVVNDEYTFTNGCTGDFFYLWTLVAPQTSLDQGHFEETRDTRPWRKTPKVYDSLFTKTCINALGIKQTDSPILVLTSNLNSKRMLVVELDESFTKQKFNLQYMFKKISDYASESYYETDEKFKLSCLKRIVDCSSLSCYTRSIVGGTFAEVITTVFANLVQNPDYRRAARLNSEDFQNAVFEADKTFESLTRKINNLRDELSEINEVGEFDAFIKCRNIYEDLCLKQLMFAAMRTEEMANLEQFGLSPDIQAFLLPASKDYLMSSLRALSIREVFHGEESTIAIGFAKTFEHEVNNSVVQEMRLKCGVPMPAYFGRYDSELGKRIMEDGNFRIDLNACSHDKKWLPPEMGRSRKFYKSIGMSLSNNEEFIRLWDAIARERNLCAHAGHNVEQREGLERMLGLIRQMDSSSFWKKLFILREKILTGSDDFYGLSLIL